MFFFCRSWSSAPPSTVRASDGQPQLDTDHIWRLPTILRRDDPAECLSARDGDGAARREDAPVRAGERFGGGAGLAHLNGSNELHFGLLNTKRVDRFLLA